MDLDDFKEKCMATAVRNDTCYNLLYGSNALCGEAGELANFVKKIYRDYNGVMQSKERTAIEKEIFDCLWYCAYLADILDVTFEQITDIGFNKLAERQFNNSVGHGEG